DLAEAHGRAEPVGAARSSPPAREVGPAHAGGVRGLALRHVHLPDGEENAEDERDEIERMGQVAPGVSSESRPCQRGPTEREIGSRFARTNYVISVVLPTLPHGTSLAIRAPVTWLGEGVQLGWRRWEGGDLLAP